MQIYTYDNTFLFDKELDFFLYYL